MFPALKVPAKIFVVPYDSAKGFILSFTMPDHDVRFGAAGLSRSIHDPTHKRLA